MFIVYIPLHLTLRQVAKREITIADQSGTIRVTLWGKHAQNFDPGPNPVVSLTGLKVKEFRGGQCRHITMIADVKMTLQNTPYR